MKKIIIVEDEFRIRNGLSTLINKLDMGCKVIGEAENGFEGLKMISDMEPEVVITDIKMPKMDGLSMIRQAKEMGASCDFIILSGYAEFEYAQQGIWKSTKGDYERVSFYVAKIYQECRINTIAIFLTDSSRMTLPVGLINFQSMYSIDYGRYGCRRRKRMI